MLKIESEKLRMHGGEIIRVCRKYRNMSQADLAEKTGVTKASISLWESGKNEPRFQMVAWCLEAMGFQFDLKEIEK